MASVPVNSFNLDMLSAYYNLTEIVFVIPNASVAQDISFLHMTSSE